ncbi:MAG: hypothetical protein Kow00128_00180 [Deltaproteobacteria bacterium]
MSMARSGTSRFVTALASAFAVAALLLPRVAAADSGPVFRVSIDGRILRKASGKLVLSLSGFELGGLSKVTLRNLRTQETMEVGLSSVYWDISYSDPLPPDLLDRIDPARWIPSIVWSIPDTMEDLRDRLSRIYVHQNLLRRELGRAMVEDVEAEVRVTSRLTLNKLEKFHRVAARIAEEYLRIVREKDEINTYLYPLFIQIGFNPFGIHSPNSRMTVLQQVRDAIYWEVHRVLTQHFGIDEELVDFVFDAPPNVRHFLPFDGSPSSLPEDFFPNVTLAGESIDCAAYLQRQGFYREVRHRVLLKRFRDPFITDRLVVDRFVNQGSVVGVYGKRVAVTFIPPFMAPGETVYVSLDPEGKREVPVVLASPVPEAGYTLTAELPADVVSRIRPGMAVRRK